MRSILLTILYLASFSLAEDDGLLMLFQKGNRAFEDSSWTEAIDSYETILMNGFHHSDLYYNLGNAYYRFRSLGQAIWAYERGLLLKPGDDDLLHNLAFVKREAGISELPQPFFLFRVYDSLKSSIQPQQWLLISGVAFLMSGILFVLSHLSNPGFARITQIPFIMMIGIILISGLIFLDVHQDEITLMDAIIVTRVGIEAKSAPQGNAKTLFHLPEGTKVKIIQDQKDWLEIETIDGSKGWLSSMDVRSLAW